MKGGGGLWLPKLVAKELKNVSIFCLVLLLYFCAWSLLSCLFFFLQEADKVEARICCWRKGELKLTCCFVLYRQTQVQFNHFSPRRIFFFFLTISSALLKRIVAVSCSLHINLLTISFLTWYPSHIIQFKKIELT